MEKQGRRPSPEAHFARRCRAQEVENSTVGKESVFLLRTQFELPFHVRENEKRRLAEMTAAPAENAPNRQHTNSQSNQEIAHYSSTTSMCGLPASSSNLRVSISEYCGSS